MDSFVMHHCAYARCGQRHPAHLMTYSDGNWYCRNNGCAALHRAERIAHEKNPDPIQVQFKFKPMRSRSVPIDYGHFGAE